MNAYKIAKPHIMLGIASILAGFMEFIRAVGIRKTK